MIRENTLFCYIQSLFSFYKKFREGKPENFKTTKIPQADQGAEGFFSYTPKIMKMYHGLYSSVFL